MNRLVQLTAISLGMSHAVYEHTGYFLLVILTIVLIMVNLSMIFGFITQTVKNATITDAKDRTYSAKDIGLQLVLICATYLIVAATAFQIKKYTYQSQGNEVIAALERLYETEGKFPEDFSAFGEAMRGTKTYEFFYTGRGSDDFKIMKEQRKMFFFQSGNYPHNLYIRSMGEWVVTNDNELLYSK